MAANGTLNRVLVQLNFFFHDIQIVARVVGVKYKRKKRSKRVHAHSQQSVFFFFSEQTTLAALHAVKYLKHIFVLPATPHKLVVACEQQSFLWEDICCVTSGHAIQRAHIYSTTAVTSRSA